MRISLWLRCGKQDAGFVHDMRCATRKTKQATI